MCKVWRKGQEKDVHVTLGELPGEERARRGRPAAQPAPARAGQVTVDPLGMTLAAITPELKSQYNIADTAKGVIVTDVKPNSRPPRRACGGRPRGGGGARKPVTNRRGRVRSRRRKRDGSRSCS